jgi:hypothetical protein
MFLPYVLFAFAIAAKPAEGGMASQDKESRPMTAYPAAGAAPISLRIDKPA